MLLQLESEREPDKADPQTKASIIKQRLSDPKNNQDLNFENNFRVDGFTKTPHLLSLYHFQISYVHHKSKHPYVKQGLLKLQRNGELDFVTHTSGRPSQSLCFDINDGQLKLIPKNCKS